MYSKKMIKIITAIVLVAFTNSQTFASSQRFSAQIELAEVVSVVSSAADSNEILAQAKDAALRAHQNGVTEKEFITSISEQLKLELTEAEIDETIADIRADHSKERLESLASELIDLGSEERVVAVLLTFLISSILLVGFFFMIADVGGWEVERG